MDIGQMLVEEVTKEVEKRFNVSSEMLKGIVADELSKHSKTITIKRKDLPEIKFDAVHSQFEKLLRLMSCRVPVFITGPAGSGKTKAVEQASDALGLEFSAVSVGPQTTQSHLMGYMDATGRYVVSEFRKRFENGGVFLIDEFDAGSPQVLTCLNSALSGSFCAFPDAMVKKHADFLCIATGNTYGNGANRIYVGRNQLDGATLDRFVVLEFDYCEKLERKLTNNDAWLERVQVIRNKVSELGIRVVISPRASIYGAKLLESGFTQKEVESMTIFKGMSKEDMERVC